MSRTIAELMKIASEKLTLANVPDAAIDARLLLEHTCHVTRNDLLVHGDKVPAPEEEELFLELLEKRANRIPLQQLTQTQCFMGLDFFVNESVLIPRADTEILVEEALQHTFDGMRILDLCTGSGCILISLLKYKRDCAGLGVDISADALKVAAKNAKTLLGQEKVCESGQENEAGAYDIAFGGDSCCFAQMDLLTEEAWNSLGEFEIIVSNPPYIATGEIASLEPEVKEHEPFIALDGSESGLLFYETITRHAMQHMPGGGMLFYEIGYDQAAAVQELMKTAGFIEVTVLQDYAGLDRVVYGTKPSVPIFS